MGKKPLSSITCQYRTFFDATRVEGGDGNALGGFWSPNPCLIPTLLPTYHPISQLRLTFRAKKEVILALGLCILLGSYSSLGEGLPVAVLGWKASVPPGPSKPAYDAAL